MTVIVFGSTGKTGIAIVKKIMVNEHEVTALVRYPQRLDVNDSRIKVAVGDIFDLSTIEKAVKSSDLKWTIIRPS